jgi:hypothetical protein
MTSSLGLGRDGDDVAGWPVPVAQRWVSGESEMFFETPYARPRMKWRDGLVRSRGSLEAQQRES